MWSRCKWACQGVVAYDRVVRHVQGEGSDLVMCGDRVWSVEYTILMLFVVHTPHTQVPIVPFARVACGMTPYTWYTHCPHYHIIIFSTSTYVRYVSIRAYMLYAVLGFARSAVWRWTLFPTSRFAGYFVCFVVSVELCFLFSIFQGCV